MEAQGGGKIYPRINLWKVMELELLGLLPPDLHFWACYYKYIM